MGIIEDRLAALEAKEQVRVDHQWFSTHAHGSGSGGYECRLCGEWMSGFKDPTKYVSGCPGGTETWRLLKVGDRVRMVDLLAPTGANAALVYSYPELEYTIDRFEGESAVVTDGQGTWRVRTAVLTHIGLRSPGTPSASNKA